MNIVNIYVYQQIDGNNRFAVYREGDDFRVPVKTIAAAAVECKKLAPEKTGGQLVFFPPAKTSMSIMAKSLSRRQTDCLRRACSSFQAFFTQGSVDHSGDGLDIFVYREDPSGCYIVYRDGDSFSIKVKSAHETINECQKLAPEEFKNRIILICFLKALIFKLF
jgi:hypothetical protein